MDDSSQIEKGRTSLPDDAVGILKGWIFDHVENPYPTMAEKDMLGRRTGLSQLQIKNWFANARRRALKRYKEEQGEQSLGSDIQSSQTRKPPRKKRILKAPSALYYCYICDNIGGNMQIDDCGHKFHANCLRMIACIYFDHEIIKCPQCSSGITSCTDVIVKQSMDSESRHPAMTSPRKQNVPLRN